MKSSIDNDTIERALKLLDSGYHSRGEVSRMVNVSLEDVDRIRSGALCPRIDLSDYKRCPKCGFLVRMPCIACLSKDGPVTLVLAMCRGDYTEWVNGNRLTYKTYRYVGGIHHLLSFTRRVRFIRLPGWHTNSYYDRAFRKELISRDCLDVTNDYKDTFDVEEG